MVAEKICNADQGAQWTSEAFTGVLIDAGVDISMDGKGRSVKYEDVYLKAYATVAEAPDGLGTDFEFYNHERRHQRLDQLTPEQVYTGDYIDYW